MSYEFGANYGTIASHNCQRLVSIKKDGDETLTCSTISSLKQVLLSKLRLNEGQKMNLSLNY